jgi:hypothetical protein
VTYDAKREADLFFEAWEFTDDTGPEHPRDLTEALQRAHDAGERAGVGRALSALEDAAKKLLATHHDGPPRGWAREALKGMWMAREVIRALADETGESSGATTHGQRCAGRSRVAAMPDRIDYARSLLDVRLRESVAAADEADRLAGDFMASTGRAALDVIEAAVVMEPWAACRCDEHIADGLDHPCDMCLFGTALDAWRTAVDEHREESG